MKPKLIKSACINYPELSCNDDFIGSTDMLPRWGNDETKSRKIFYLSKLTINVLKTILVIENDIDTLDVIEAFLADTDFKLIRATGIIPVNQIIDINPNVIVLDYWLDNGYGTHLCFEIKTNSLTKHIPVLIYSADKGAEKAALECRADAFIEKPFDLNEFESIIKQWTS